MIWVFLVTRELLFGQKTMAHDNGEGTIRPDFSNYVAHFTTDRAPLGNQEEAGDAVNLAGIARLTAYERLEAILQQKIILATPMPWTGRRAVAFTECPWGSLLRHAGPTHHMGSDL